MRQTYFVAQKTENPDWNSNKRLKFKDTFCIFFLFLEVLAHSYNHLSIVNGEKEKIYKIEKRNYENIGSFCMDISFSYLFMYLL